MKYITALIFITIDYLVGSLPWALIIGKLKYHTDVREYGSGNLGATNTGRVLGKKAAFIVGLLDGLKGLVMFIITYNINKPIALLTIIAVAIGHCYPIFANFKGGKAVATSAGIILAICLTDIKLLAFVFLPSLIIWLLITKLTDYISLASIISLLVAAIISIYVSKDPYITIAISELTLLVVIKHKENIKRLLNGTENKKNY